MIDDPPILAPIRQRRRSRYADRELVSAQRKETTTVCVSSRFRFGLFRAGAGGWFEGWTVGREHDLRADPLFDDYIPILLFGPIQLDLPTKHLCVLVRGRTVGRVRQPLRPNQSQHKRREHLAFVRMDGHYPCQTYVRG